HVWLDPENAKAMVAYIAEILSRKDPAHSDAFRSNAQDLRQRLELLRRELEQTLAPIADRPYVVFHDAMQYFEQRFGLNGVGSISVSPEISPSAARLVELRRKLRAAGAQCAFAEPQFSMALVNTVVEGTGARIGMLDPEAINLAPGPDLYFTLLRTLATDLTRCLATPACDYSGAKEGTHKKMLSAFVFLGSFAVHPAAAQSAHRELGPHEHGRGTLNIAIEGNRVSMELEVPGMDIAGFEHAAKT